MKQIKYVRGSKEVTNKTLATWHAVVQNTQRVCPGVLHVTSMRHTHLRKDYGMGAVALMKKHVMRSQSQKQLRQERRLHILDLHGPKCRQALVFLGPRSQGTAISDK